MQITPLHDWIRNKTGADRSSFDRRYLERYQLDCVRKVVTYATKKSPFYRKLFGALEPPASFQEFCVFPFTTADDLLENPTQFVCAKQDEIQRIVTLPTSGTTGPAKRVYFSAADQELTIDFFHMGMSTLAAPGDRVLILLPAQREGSVGDLLRMGLLRLGCVPFPYGPFNDEKAVLELIHEKKINILVGSPVQLHRLLRWDQANSLLPDGQIQKVLVSTDILPQTIRLNLQQFWHCEVFDHYGMTETGLGGGVECASHNGYHLREADLYYEIIDPVTGQSLQEGQTGEVVVTTLTRMGMPLVRYRTGDISRLRPGNCICGSFIKRMEKIHSRIQAGVNMRSGVLFPSNLDETLFKFSSILDFSSTLKHGISTDVLTLDLVIIDHDLLAIEKQILSSLMELPTLESGVHSQTLQVVINQVEALDTPARGLSKRRVVEVG